MDRFIERLICSLALCSLLIFSDLHGQSYPVPAKGVDVLHYQFAIRLNDDGAGISNTAAVTVRFTEAGIKNWELDLADQTQTNNGKGMKVESVSDSTGALDFKHEQSRLNIFLKNPTQAGQVKVFRLNYSGVPADGLIIGKNKYGDRTFFGDNWPDRAHNWLAVVDHPADKATVEFAVTAPQKYQVVANGYLVEETDLGKGLRLTRWKTANPIPTKVMVLGAAEFAVEYVEEVNDVPVSTWVYPQDRDKGFYDYAIAVDILRYLEEYIGPYPYAKLANVQSKTRFGGMENASNIFYSESSVTGDRSSESLLAHEIAHQWFGNSASEADWPHIWLSEGFATYFSAMYMEHRYGPEKLREILELNRQIVFRQGPDIPVVQTEVSNLMQLLNANSYQKGGWILHMLRRQMGDSLFQAGVRTYYDRFKHGSATTDKLKQVMEEVSGQDLSAFFQQWLYQAGYPKLSLRWEYNQQKKKVICIFNQTQSGTSYRFPLKVHFLDKNGGLILEETCNLSDRKHRYEFSLDKVPDSVVCDPDADTLVEVKIYD